MAKGDDAVRKKKNKVLRKRMQRDPSTISARVAAIIATKQRRKSGKRRICEGMCFSLPTPENPFNDRPGKEKRAKMLDTPQTDAGISRTEKGAAPRKVLGGRNSGKVDKREPNKEKFANLKNEQRKLLPSISNTGQTVLLEPEKTTDQLLRKCGEVDGNSDCPSKFLILCLNAIQNLLLNDGTFNGDTDRPLLVNMWGVEFWKCYSVGSDILETSGACSTIEQTAWMASTAADSIARKEKEGLSVANPFLLFLVPSQEKAIKVRSVCKPLKALGIHTVSLHPGASLEHQIHGLRRCEPEFLVSTPERLLELISLKAIDISGVSLLVVDGLETFVKGGFLDKIKSIRQSVSGDPQTVIFNDCFRHLSPSMAQNLLKGSICRLCLNESITSQSACIVQCIHVSASEEGKLSEGIQVLDQACGSQLPSLLRKVLFIVGTDGRAQVLLTTLRAKGYSISNDSVCDDSLMICSDRNTIVSVTNKEHIARRSDIGEFEVVVIIDFLSSINDYVSILTGMARHTVNGVLHSFFSREDTPLAKPLIEVLEQCDQTVPDALRKFCDSTTFMSEH